jgi:glycosyltransferase involved in cell wall biosynthesis
MKLSILTVVKNDKKNLLISLESVLSQRFKNFEHIICDGMSNDGTKSIVKEYLNKNTRYICIRDKNYYEALNYAIKSARGDYIGILNAGDKYFNSGILEKVNKKILTTKCDLLFGNLIYFNDKNYSTRIWNFQIKDLNSLSALKIASPTLFVKKKIAISNLYNTKYNISSDTDFNIRISKKNLNYVYLNQFMVLMKIGGLSTNPKFFLKKMAQDILILRKYFKFLFIFVYLFKVLIKLRTLKVYKKKIYNVN